MGKVIDRIINTSISILILYAAVFILMIFCIFLLRSNCKLEKKYRKLMRGVNSGNLESLVMDYFDRIDTVKGEIKDIQNDIGVIENKLKKCIQKKSVLRYKAFEDVGCDLSYSLALLDENEDGVILTAIYGRNQSTSYVKPIDKGISRYELSNEEKEVLKDAMNEIKY